VSKVKREKGKPRNGERHDFYSLGDQTNEDKMSKYVASIGEKVHSYRILIGKKKRKNYEDLGIDGRVLGLAQYRHKPWVSVNTVNTIVMIHRGS
jgi:hypothetical protein